MFSNFIDFENLNDDYSDCQRDLVADDDEKIVIHVSNLRKVKRIDDVIQIFYKIEKQVKSKLIIIGDGPEREAASDLAHKLGIRDKIIFLGKSNEVEKILCYSDLFLLPSEKESFGLSALEAMALKVPIISTNIGGLKELNIDNNFGYTSDVGDTGKMAKDSIKILSDSKLQQKFRDNAFENAKKFDIKNIIPLYEDLYKNAIK